MRPIAAGGTGHRPGHDHSSAGSSDHPVVWADLSGDTHRCLSDVVETLKPQIEAKRLNVTIQFLARDYRLARSPERLRRVFGSMLRTAVGSAPAGGRITLRSTCPGEGVLRVEVTEHRRRRERGHRLHN